MKADREDIGDALLILLGIAVLIALYLYATQAPQPVVAPPVSSSAGLPTAAPDVPSPRPVPSRAARSRPSLAVAGGTAHTHPPRQRRDGLNWTALARCESTNNPRAVSPSGKYRGAYQMDASFWRTYGGLAFASRPDLASLAEQTVVAQRGYAARGIRPWPSCGYLLLRGTR